MNDHKISSQKNGVEVSHQENSLSDHHMADHF
jgi:hypothetical protein